MKKRLLLLPLFAMVLSSCDFIYSIVNKDDKPTQDVVDDDDHHEDDDDHEDDTPVKVDSISLNKTSLTLTEGESENLSYTILPVDAENKNVTWSTSNAGVANVSNGVISAISEGTCNITVTTIDGNKTSSCSVTVNKKEQEKILIEDTFDLNTQGYSFEKQELIENPITFKGYTISFAIGENTYNNKPIIQKTTKNKYEARLYWGNTFTVTSSVNILEKISFTLGENDKGNGMTVSTGSFDNGDWVGKAKEIVFTISGTSGYRAFEAFTLCFEGSAEEDDNTFVNLGEKTIKEVKEYIAEHPVNKNAFGNGVNEKRLVTIKGYALAKIDLIKSSASYGLNVSEHGKVIMGDATGVIAAATTVNNQGTSLWGKVADYACKDTSKYVVSGYISEYLGHPEIVVTEFEYDSTLSITVDFASLSQETVTLEQFYTKAQNVNYNCAGHGYGDVVTVNNLKCYYVEADGQGRRYYNFTDGTKNIRVNAFNLSGATEGKIYNVTGIISLKNLSPIIIAFKITPVNEGTVTFDYKTAATSLSISELKAIKGSQDDTSTRYPAVVNVYSSFYKTTAYMVAVEEGGKLYVGISDTPRTTIISGKTNAMANYNVVLIKNSNFWNTTEDELYLFNPIYEEYLCEETPIEIYYIARQLDYSSGKAMWQILLVPDFINSLMQAE